MSVYLSLDSGEPEMLASNKGWSDACEWADGLDTDDEAELIHLCDYGWSQNLDTLVKCIESGLHAAPPEDKTVSQTMAALQQLLASRGDAEVCTVNNGMGPDDESDDAEVELAVQALLTDQ